MSTLPEMIILYNWKSEKEKKKPDNLGQKFKEHRDHICPSGWSGRKGNSFTVSSTFKNTAQIDNSNHILQRRMDLWRKKSY